MQKGELEEQLRGYIAVWKKQRAKKDEELKRLKDKQAKRKEIRAEQKKNCGTEKG
jgi:troponin T